MLKDTTLASWHILFRISGTVERSYLRAASSHRESMKAREKSADDAKRDWRSTYRAIILLKYHYKLSGESPQVFADISWKFMNPLSAISIRRLRSFY